jgi:hypothetical protein
MKIEVVDNLCDPLLYMKLDVEVFDFQEKL